MAISEKLDDLRDYVSDLADAKYGILRELKAIDQSVDTDNTKFTEIPPIIAGLNVIPAGMKIYSAELPILQDTLSNATWSNPSNGQIISQVTLVRAGILSNENENFYDKYTNWSLLVFPKTVTARNIQWLSGSFISNKGDGDYINKQKCTSTSSSTTGSNTNTRTATATLKTTYDAAYLNYNPSFGFFVGVTTTTAKLYAGAVYQVVLVCLT